MCLLIVNPSDDEHPRTLTADDAIAIAESATFAPDLTDPNTWFDAATALP